MNDCKQTQTTQKPRLFVDMDGTLAEWRNIEIPLNECDDAEAAADKLFAILQTKGYYYSLRPNCNVVDAVKQIIRNNHMEVYILSCYPPDGKTSSPKQEKEMWLDKYLPEIDKNHRLFVPYGESKTDYLPRAMKKDDALLDDKTSNLMEFEQEGGHGIKLLNNVNSSYGTWIGDRVSYVCPSDVLAESIEKVLLKGYQVQHAKPERNVTHFDFEHFDFEECFEETQRDVAPHGNDHDFEKD